MTAGSGFLVALAAMGLASIVCRLAGFALMRHVAVTPRIEAALAAMPLAVMIGILTPFLLSGEAAALVGLAAVAAIMKLTGSDLVAALGGVAAVALLRASGL